MQGRGGLGSRKHGKSGYATQSPRFRFLTRLEAERNEIKNRSKIRQPARSLRELLKGK